MGTVLIRHNDFEKSMEQVARDIFGDDAQMFSKEGEHGERILCVVGDNVSPHSIDDLERGKWVLSAKYVK